MESERNKQIVKLCVAISILVIVLIVAGILMLKYEVEGDTNMPFNLTKMVVVSTAEGVETEGKKKWNFNIYQNNDLYLYVDKNDNYYGKDTYIQSVRIENIQVPNPPKYGEVKAYMPNSTEGRTYSYGNEYIVDKKLEYRGASKGNLQALEIGSQGGNALIRFSNTNLKEYSSDADKEIVHDGTLLKKLDITKEDIKFTVSFDFIIKTKNSTYRANINLDLPTGDILEKGTESMEKTDMSDIIFKKD